MAVDTRRLKYFVQVAESGSLSKAAEVLHIAQPALSRQIQLFEEYLDFALFVRTGRGMQLTREGSYLLDGVVGPLRDLELAVENMRSFMSREGDIVFGLGIDTGLAPVLAAGVIARLQAELPAVRFRLLEAPSVTLGEWLKKGNVDFALLDQSLAENTLSMRLLANEDLVVVSTAGGSGDLPPVTINELKALDLILPPIHHGIRKIVEEAMNQAKVGLRIAFETDSLSLMVQQAEQGKGALLLPRSLAGLVCSGKNLAMRALDLPVLRSRIFLASRSYGEIEGSLITKIDTIIKETVIDLLADQPTT